MDDARLADLAHRLRRHLLPTGRLPLARSAGAHFFLVAARAGSETPIDLERRLTRALDGRGLVLSLSQDPGGPGRPARRREPAPDVGPVEKALLWRRD